MITEIEELKKLAASKITKGRLAAIKAAYESAHELFGRLEPKPGDEDAAGEFEDAALEVEDALSELDEGCDNLDAAEDKEERDEAIEQIVKALDDAVSSMETIMGVAVVRSVNHRKIIDECQAKLSDLILRPKMTNEEFNTAIYAWLDSSATPELKQQRLEVIEEILAPKQKKPSSTSS